MTFSPLHVSFALKDYGIGWQPGELQWAHSSSTLYAVSCTTINYPPSTFVQTMYSLVLIRYRVPIDVVESVTEEHRAYLRELKAAGILVASGPFIPRTGGALLLRVPDADSAAAIDAVRNGDPFFKQGIANYELLSWNPVIGREGLDAL